MTQAAGGRRAADGSITRPLARSGPAPQAAAHVEPVALLGVGAGIPSLRLQLEDLAAAWGGPGRGGVAVCDDDEDTFTLAWSAATAAMSAAGVVPEDMSGLWWGTSRPPMAEGPSHAFLAAALGLSATSAGLLASGSPSSGMDALFAAWDAVASSHASLALVVASDALVPGTGTAGEAATGAGAAAFVLASPSVAARSGGPPALLVFRATRSLPALDRYRPDAGTATGDTYDGRLFREKVFVPLATGVASLLAGGGPAGTPLSLSDPDGKLAAPCARRLGRTLVSSEARRTLGDTGSASAFLGAMSALAEPGCLAVVGYGGGRASGLTVELARPVPGAAAAATAIAGASSGARVASYTQVLRARGQLEAMGDPVPMAVPPGSAAFVRGNAEMLALQGARCARCGTISTPPSIHPVCSGCGSGPLETVTLSREGTVQTFVVNHTMPAPFQAPLPLIVIDLDDGARVMLQGTSADAGALAIGDRVHLVLRRYAIDRGVPVYGYKALRAQPSAPGERAGPGHEAEGRPSVGSLVEEARQ